MGKKHQYGRKLQKLKVAKSYRLKKGEFLKPKGTVLKNLREPFKKNKGSEGSGAGGKAGLADTYEVGKRILLVGEANFSFARALVREWGSKSVPNLTATNYDTEEVIREKYPDADDIAAELLSHGVELKYGIDARNLQGDLKLGGGKKRVRAGRKSKGPCDDDTEAAGEDAWKYDMVVFNFPHVGLGIKDQAHNVLKNKELLSGFFQSAMTVLRPGGLVHVAVKTGEPYSLWNVCGVAHAASRQRLKLKTSYNFTAEAFTGYAHRRTLGFKEGMSAEENEEIIDGARTYAWTLLPPPSN